MKIGYAVGLLLLGVFFGLLSVSFPDAAHILIPAGVLCAIGIFVIYGLLLWEQAESYMRTLRFTAESLEGMSPERFEVFGIALPRVRVRWSGSQAVMFYDDTDVPMVVFKRFLDGSDKRQIFPLRNCRGDLITEGQWNEIRMNLEGRGLVKADSAAGSHSWLWRNEFAYEKTVKHFSRFFWLFDGIENLNAEDDYE